MNNIRFLWPKAITLSELPNTTRHVLLTLATYMNSAGRCHPTYNQLAQACGLTSRAVGEHLRKAEAEGWIVVQRLKTVSRRWFAKQYKAVLPERFRTPSATPGSQADRRNLTQVGVEGDSSPDWNDVPTNNTINNTKNNGAAGGAISDEAFVLVWDSFPRNPQSTKAAAYSEWRKLSGEEQNTCTDAALTFAVEFAAKQTNTVSEADGLTFVPRLATWIRRREWLS